MTRKWALDTSCEGARLFGRRWVESAGALAMLVPSAISPESVNAVINPRHPAYRDIRVEIMRAFTFDARMIKA